MNYFLHKTNASVILKKLHLLVLAFLLLGMGRNVLAQSTTNHIVISEIYGGGGNSGATWKSDFIELYNPTESTVNLANWSIQYASSTGSSWAVTILNGSIAPRSFYLVKQADGAGGSVDLPTPDASGGISMAAGAGKVALVNSTSPLSGTTPALATVIDLVGYGTTAGYFEGSGPTATINATSSVERKANVNSTAVSMAGSGLDANAGNGYDTNDNRADFVLQTNINPQNSSSPAEPGAPGTDPSLSTAPASIDFGNQNINVPSPETTFTLSYANLNTTDVVLTTVAPFSISKISGSGFGTSLTLTAAERTGNSITIYVVANLTSTGATTGTISFSGGGATAGTLDLNANGIDPSVTTLISTIQGAGNAAIAGTYTVEAVVTGVYNTLSPAGFYIQEEDADWDSDVNTSEGIFVVQNNPTVSIGDLVRVTGTAQENSSTPSFNQAVIINPNISVVSASNPLPSFTLIDKAAYTNSTAEKYEAMRVSITGELTVADNSSLASFGELTLSMDGSIFNPTQIVDPNDNPATGTSSSGTSNVAAVNAYATANADKVIVLDDGSGVAPTILPYIDPVLKTVRVNSTTSGVKGILGYAFNKYRIQPLPGADAPASFAVTRPAAPTFPTLDVKLASFNVLNYFNGDGLGGGFPTSRGALTADAFAIQRSKIIEAIAQINADAVGLIEIENDGIGANSAIQDLVNGLNAKMGTGTYSIINDGATIQDNNTDLIRCAIIYKSTVLTPVGDARFANVEPLQRPSLVQGFNAKAKNEKFIFIINHFKSKSGTGSGIDADQNDGQGNFNGQRKEQASGLASFIQTISNEAGGTDRIVSVGDYNAYYEEDPMDIFRANGLIVPSTATEHSYLFGGALGSLDHAVVSSTMSNLVSVKKWNINSNEPLVLQYSNTAFTDATSPFRSSDHDPVIIGVDFSGLLPVRLVSFKAQQLDNQVKISWSTTSETNNSHFTIERSADAIQFEEIGVVDGAGDSFAVKNYSLTDINPLTGTSYYRLRQTDLDGTFTNSRIVSIKFDGTVLNQFSVYPNPVSDHLNLKFDHNLQENALLRYEIVNQNGVKLFEGSGNISEIGKGINKVIPVIKTGIYMIRIGDSNGSNVVRFLKQ